MCSGARRKVGPDEGEISGQEILLELSASDDLERFRAAVEEEGLDVNMSGLWYGRRIGSKTMGYEERTPLMIASIFGSKRVLNYIIKNTCFDVNRACGSDGATALHCAVAGGSDSSLDVIKLLLDSSAHVDLVDANGNRPADLIPFCRFSSKMKMLAQLLNGCSDANDEGYALIDHVINPINPNGLREGSERKEYPFDPSLPDIKNGVYGTDDFRMYTFKVKPCSRAYSHDWTECPFAHPGENARRRDPRKYHYSCVPCPDFRKGTCQRGDACEYSHGIFECWLHPAQYRTRMCKDESNCNRRVCFFAHKPEELRASYVSSPRSSYSHGASPFDVSSISPLALGSPSLQFSRLKATLNARDMDFDHLRHETFLDDVSALSSPSSWSKMSSGAFCASSDDVFGAIDHPSILSQLQSPKAMQMRQNMNQALLSSSPTNPRSSAFAKRSQSFIDRSAAKHGVSSSPISPAAAMPSTLFGWGSPDGKLDWGIKKGELSKFRKSASFGIRSSGNSFAINSNTSFSTTVDEPDVLWVQSLVKDDSDANPGQFSIENQQFADMHPIWAEQLYMEQEQIMA